MNARKFGLLLAVVCLVAGFFALGLDRYLDLAWFRTQQHLLANQVKSAPWISATVYFGLYVLVTALSLPGATVMTLAGGALFGFATTMVLVSFASSIGALLAFLIARYLLRDWVQARFGSALEPINDGMRKDGAFYLFSLRLVPAFPFFIINLAMALTPISARTFYWVSQLGMLAGTAAYVNAGTEIAHIDSLAGILSPPLIGAFVLLGLLPLLARRLLRMLRVRRLYRRWRRPARFDYNLVVIGAGSAGLITAYIGAAVKARVALIERHRMGGDCLNTGCVPSKALLRSARLLAQIARAPSLGIRKAGAQFDFADVMKRIARVVRQIEPHDSVDRYREMGVHCLTGQARITSPWTVEVTDADGGTQTLSTRAIVIAAGARPKLPQIPGIDRIDVLTSDTVWSLRTLPPRLLVLGGGPVGCELAQAFARFGSKVTQVESAPRLMAREDPDVSALLARQFSAEGITVLTGHRALRFACEADGQVLYADGPAGEVRIAFDALLCAVGRTPNVEGYGLEELGIGLRPDRTVDTDDCLATLYPNIYASGDVTGPFQFTHTAAHQAWYAAVNALFGRFRRFRVDYSVIPRATFTEPEIARVGLNESEATARGIAHEVTTYPLDDLDRAITDEVAGGFIKVLTVPGSDRILGATVVGEHAGETIGEYVLAMKNGLGLNRILATLHIYPTMNEGNKFAAGVWKKAHAPQTLLAWAARYHAWMRR
ncbi:MAG TPA: FAD-dependent oxidoreductase [Methyloversatilis sp.]